MAVVVAADQNPTAIDSTSPLLTVQPARFVVGESIGGAYQECPERDDLYNNVTMRLEWEAQDATSGVATYDIARDDNDAGPIVAQPRTTATSAALWTTNYDNDCGGGFHRSYWWIVARDFRGFTALSPEISDHVDVWDENGIDRTQTTDELGVARTGTWGSSACACHNQGKTVYTRARGASTTFTVNVDRPGRTFAVVAPTGNARGVMNISVDGGPTAAVNTYISSSTNVNRVIVWQKTLDAGRHTVRIVNAATAGHPRIDIDTVMLGPAWFGESLQMYDLGSPS